MRFLTYNVHSGVGTDGAYDVSRVAATAAAGKPDIVALQEIENNAPSVSAIEEPTSSTTPKVTASKVNGEEDNTSRSSSEERARCRIWSAVHKDDQPGQIAQACELPYVSFIPTLEASVVEGEKGEILRGTEPSATDEGTEKQNTAAKIPEEEQRATTKAAAGKLKGRCRYGNAIASRFPILCTEVLRYRQPLKPGERINMASEEQPRLAMACLLDIGQEEEPSTQGEAESRSSNHKHGTRVSRLVWVVNTHLSHKVWHAEQARQARQCAHWVATDLQSIARESHPQQDHGTPVLLAGDLNSPVELLWGWVSLGGYNTLVKLAGFVDLRLLPADKKENNPKCPTVPPSYHDPKRMQWRLPSLDPKQLLPSARIDHVLAYIPSSRTGGEEGRSEKESNTKKGGKCMVASVACESMRVLKEEAMWRVASDHCAVVASVTLNWGPIPD